MFSNGCCPGGILDVRAITLGCLALLQVNLPALAQIQFLIDSKITSVSLHLYFTTVDYIVEIC